MMDLREAMRGYMMDGQIERQSLRALALKKQRLGRFIEWCETQGVCSLEDVTINVIRAFVVYLQSAKDLHPHRHHKLLAPLTIRGYVKVVRAFFAWCKREGLLGAHDDPAARVPRVKVPQYVIETFTPEQMEAMLQACDRNTPLGYRHYTVLLVLMDTGIRVSELCNLKLQDVHENYLTVFGKGEKEREVGLGPTAARALWKYLHQYRQAASEREQHVFLTNHGRRLDTSDVWRTVRDAGMLAGVEGVRLSPHTFRHTFAVAWLDGGGDVFKLSRLLGHSEIQTTQLYLKDFQSRDARADHAQFSPVERFRLGKRLDAKDKGRKRQ